MMAGSMAVNMMVKFICDFCGVIFGWVRFFIYFCGVGGN